MLLYPSCLNKVYKSEVPWPRNLERELSLARRSCSRSCHLLDFAVRRADWAPDRPGNADHVRQPSRRAFQQDQRCRVVHYWSPAPAQVGWQIVWGLQVGPNDHSQNLEAGLHVRRKHKRKPKPRVNRDDASTSTSISASISHVWTGTTQAQEKGTRACACACVVPVHTWLMLVLASYVKTCLKKFPSRSSYSLVFFPLQWR